jgi:hypothetical protein
MHASHRHARAHVSKQTNTQTRKHALSGSTHVPSANTHTHAHTYACMLYQALHKHICANTRAHTHTYAYILYQAQGPPSSSATRTVKRHKARGNEGRFPMFPHNEELYMFDEYGEICDTSIYLRCIEKALCVHVFVLSVSAEVVFLSRMKPVFACLFCISRARCTMPAVCVCMNNQTPTLLFPHQAALCPYMVYIIWLCELCLVT